MQKIIWLVDPYEDLKSLKPAAQWVKALAEKLKAPIQPVHVLAGGAAGFAPEIHAAWLMQFVIDTEDRLVQVVNRLAIPRLLKPHVISEVYRSRSEAVHGLLEFARDGDAQLIVLGRGHREKKGEKMGGFAETLLLKSGIPVLVIPEQSVARTKKLLVALDLSEVDGEVAREVFKRSIDWARRLGSSLHLFHVLPVPATIAYGPGAFDLGASAAASVYWSEEAARLRRKQLERLQKIAVKKGVKCTVELETRSIRAAEAILRAQKRIKADWIVMAGRTGRWSSILLGSVTRVVAREAPCPVWIIHLDKKELGKKHLERGRPAARAA